MRIARKMTDVKSVNDGFNLISGNNGQNDMGGDGDASIDCIFLFHISEILTQQSTAKARQIRKNAEAERKFMKKFHFVQS